MAMSMSVSPTMRASQRARQRGHGFGFMALEIFAAAAIVAGTASVGMALAGDHILAMCALIVGTLS